jgi:teichuronic acid biosynthesis glycosyltransferase TuaC
MKILTFTSLFPNRERPDFGIFIYQRTANLAARQGNFVEVVAPIPYFPTWIDLGSYSSFARIPREEVIHALRVHHPRYPLLPGISMPFHGRALYLGSRNTVRNLFNRFNFDCIDAHYIYPDGYAAVRLGKMLNLPVVVSARGSDINSFSAMPLIRPMIRSTLRRATRIIAVSQALKQAMVQLGSPENKISVIPNGVNLERFQPLAPLQARQNLGLSPHGKITITVGSLTENKNHTLLIQAFNKLLKNHPEYQLYIIGLGPLRERLIKQVESSGFQRNIFLLGSRPNEELQAWFSAADLSCLVSSREGWPNVVMESLACGTPVLATRVGGIPEIIVSDQLGVFVDPTIDSISAGLESALERSWDREAIAQHGRLRNWSRVAAEVEATLQSAVDDFNDSR